MNIRSLLLSASALFLGVGSHCAHAAYTQVTESNPAVAVCQAARSANEGSLRKRPMAVQNEGASSVFVTCGLHGNGDIGPANSTIHVTLRVINIGAVPVTVSCTAVDVSIGAIGPTKSTIVMPNTVTPLDSTPMQFFPIDMNPDERWFTPAFSCVLPPGAGILDIWHSFRQELGIGH